MDIGAAAAPVEQRVGGVTPLIDLHRHLEGSIRVETVLDLARQHGLPLPAYDPEELRPYMQVTGPLPGLMAFISKIEFAAGVLADYGACRRVAYECVEDATSDGITYLEARFSPLFMAGRHGLDPEGVVEAVADGVKGGARDHGVRANLIGILSRHYGPESAWRELEALLAYRDDIVALDLAGDEANWPGEPFVEHFRRGREAGWRATVHAGEAAGPEGVRQAILGLGAERVGHATRAVEDPALLDFMQERRVGIEANLTSNVHTGTVKNLEHHPLRFYLERGLLATINTDDPATSGITLSHEYEEAAPAAGLDERLVRKARANAVEIAFLSESDKAALRARST